MRGLLVIEHGPICFGSLKHIKSGHAWSRNRVKEHARRSHFIYSPRCDSPRSDTVYKISCCHVQITSKPDIIISPDVTTWFFSHFSNVLAKRIVVLQKQCDSHNEWQWIDITSGLSHPRRQPEIVANAFTFTIFCLPFNTHIRNILIRSKNALKTCTLKEVRNCPSVTGSVMGQVHADVWTTLLSRTVFYFRFKTSRDSTLQSNGS